MALIDSLNSTNLGLGGETPANREGASADTSKVHVDGQTQTAEHSALDLDANLSLLMQVV